MKSQFIWFEYPWLQICKAINYEDNPLRLHWTHFRPIDNMDILKRINTIACFPPN